MTATQPTFLVPERRYYDLAHCIVHGICWWCGEPVSEYTLDNPGGISTPPMCGQCKGEHQAPAQKGVW